MKRQMLGRGLALALGMILGILGTLVMMPLHLDGEWMMVNRLGYSVGKSPRVGDRVIIENAVFTEQGDGGRLARRVARVDGDLLYVLCDEDQEGLDSRSEAVGLIPKEEIWGRVVYTRKENSHGTEKAPGEQ
ncbi:MAG: hypothetical protein IJ994_01495 [Firmicutes bacterium]|nr:hypothetical protein [Bacillota bacterium]